MLQKITLGSVPKEKIGSDRVLSLVLCCNTDVETEC